MLKRSAITLLIDILALFPCLGASAATIATHKTHTKPHKITETTTAQKKMARLKHSSKTAASRNSSSYQVSRYEPVSKRHYYERFYASSFADNQVEGDITAGEDPIVRAAAVEALGNMNGTIVAMDPDSGRILAMVNQKLALSAGAQPCSTIKVAVASGRAERERHHQRHAGAARQVLARGLDHSAGPLEQRLFRSGGAQAWL